MRRHILFIAVGVALAFTGCPEQQNKLTSKLEQQSDLPRPPTAAAPGLTSDLVPPGFSAAP